MSNDETLTKRIATLARLMTEAPDLSDVEAYFHDKIVSHPLFMAEGTPALHKPLRDIGRSCPFTKWLSPVKGQDPLSNRACEFPAHGLPMVG